MWYTSKQAIHITLMFLSVPEGRLLLELPVSDALKMCVFVSIVPGIFFIIVPVLTNDPEPLFYVV